jgi:DNA-binding NarL/FixJ family response regulator
MAEGRSNSWIHERPVLTPKAVETHVRTIFMKLGLVEADDDHRRVRAVLAFLRT